MPEIQLIQGFAKEFGIFAALFTSLLLYVLSENSKRESKYQAAIDKNQSVIEKLADIIDVKLETLEKTLCNFVGVPLKKNKKKRCR